MQKAPVLLVWQLEEVVIFCRYTRVSSLMLCIHLHNFFRLKFSSHWLHIICTLVVWSQRIYTIFSNKELYQLTMMWVTSQLLLPHCNSFNSPLASILSVPAPYALEQISKQSAEWLCQENGSHMYTLHHSHPHWHCHLPTGAAPPSNDREYFF